MKLDKERWEEYVIWNMERDSSGQYLACHVIERWRIISGIVARHMHGIGDRDVHWEHCFMVEDYWKHVENKFLVISRGILPNASPKYTYNQVGKNTFLPN